MVFTSVGRGKGSVKTNGPYSTVRLNSNGEHKTALRRPALRPWLCFNVTVHAGLRVCPAKEQWPPVLRLCEAGSGSA